MSAYTSRKAKFKYRNRIRLERASEEQSNGTTKTPYEQTNLCRERKRINSTGHINDCVSTSAAGAVGILQVDDEIGSILTPD
ncbi:uncharacterized protein TNCV_3810641 [Trichonephila clavipes]|nr:uncharacterized protein TNCV_3810641 [Trichonephila clavipes]